MSQTSEAQADFDSRYITASEIANECKVSRVSVLMARRRGDLPESILVGENRIYIWERTKARSFINAWKKALTAQREAQAQKEKACLT